MPPVSNGTDAELWRRCSSCKRALGFGARHWVCNVSTCNRPRTGLVFCTVSCWEAHVPVMRHRESWAVEKTAPRREEWEREQAASHAIPAPSALRPASPSAVLEPPARPPSPAPVPSSSPGALPREVLIVASKLKAYIRARSGMNTSDTVLGALSDAVRALCEEAIRSAQRDGRKTVMDRDFSNHR